MSASSWVILIALMGLYVYKKGIGEALLAFAIALVAVWFWEIIEKRP